MMHQRYGDYELPMNLLCIRPEKRKFVPNTFHNETYALINVSLWNSDELGYEKLRTGAPFVLRGVEYEWRY